MFVRKENRPFVVIDKNFNTLHFFINNIMYSFQFYIQNKPQLISDC